MQNIYLILTIIKRSDAKDFLNFFLEHDAAPIYSTLCNGAANSETLSILGLEKTEKVMMQSIVTHDKMYELKEGLTKEMSIDLPDRGISLMLPLSSFASRKTLDKILESQATDPRSESNTERNERKIEMELIISICSKGNTDDIMKLARAEGATGGTVVKAKGTANAGTDTFFGMAISDEKEIIYIVTKKEHKNDIMKAVASHTEESGAHPVVFSLPVTETAGFRLME